MVRDIRRLDEDIKLEYGLILASLLNNLKDADVFQMKAFYKVMAYIQIPKKQRKKITDYFISNEAKDSSIELSFDSLLSKVKGQERDILRFTLMQDIISVTMANHYLSEEKKELLEKIQQLLQITEEQMSIFEGELKHSGNLTLKEKNPDKKILFKRRMSKCIAIGIPLTFLFYSPHNAYHHSFTSFALLQIDKKINPQKSVFSLGKYLILGGILYKGFTWGMCQNIKKQDKLKKMLVEETELLMNRGRKYLEEDLTYCNKALRKNNLNDNHIGFKILMEKTSKLMND